MKQRMLLVFGIIICLAYHVNGQPKKQNLNTPELPARYFQLLESGTARVKQKMDADPNATIASLEGGASHGHFPHAVLLPAVLYTKHHPANKSYGNQNMLHLALRIGDFLVAEYNKGHYTPRGDTDWDTYMWMEAYRLLKDKLGKERQIKWREIIEKEVALLQPKLAKCIDYPWYNAPFITTSPNHYAIYASTLLVAGHVFNHPDWIKLSAQVLHRYCVEEQTADGYWGEHSQAGPTTGYDYVTTTQIALYWEYTKDPDALKALRRSTDFHKNYTYPDGNPVETINDRNRYWGVSMWGHFGFSHFSDGRRYSALLTSFFPYDGDKKSYGGDIQSLGRIAQDVIYYHEGAQTPIPQEQVNYAHTMKISAGIRKTGDWVATYSGIIAPPVTLNNFFLDRQGNFSVFNKKTGLIISGANSKHQPELATFTEVIGKDSIHMPVSSRLQMNEKIDRLALAYNVFFASLEVPAPTTRQFSFRFLTVYKWGDAVSQLNLQLILKTGLILETAAGKKIVLGNERIDWGNKELGGWIKHNGWTLRVPAGTRLTWPVFPFNPYEDKPETTLSQAIGRISITLKGEDQSFPFVLELN